MRDYGGYCLVCCGCHKKAPHTGKLITTEIYCLTILEAKSMKSRCWYDSAPSETCRGKIIPCIFLILVN